MKFLEFINKGIEFSFYLLILLVPLVFAGNTHELFEFNKMWLTFGMATIIGALWFSKMIITKKIIFKRTVFDIPILLFLAANIISTIFSLDQHVSLWGYYTRWNGGLLSIFTYIFLFYAFISNLNLSGKLPEFSTEKNRRILFFASLGAYLLTIITVGGIAAASEQSNNPPLLTGIILVLGLTTTASMITLSALSGNLVERILKISIFSGILVTIWALPSHFGFDPTCLIFRGNLDVACWTADFQPKIRVFGTLGQPNWLAGLMGIYIPITLSLILIRLRSVKNLLDYDLILYTVSFFVFYLTLLYTSSASGLLACYLSLLVFGVIYLIINLKNLKTIKNKFIPLLIAIFIITTFIAGARLPIIEKFSFGEVQKILTKPDPTSARESVKSDSSQTTPAPSTPLGGSDSGSIRLIVWDGAIKAWKDSPIIGTGVDTFAFAYYKHRPAEHNKLSEWNFLYNKAHNEYLNYLTTTGLFGLVSYMLFVFAFIFYSLINIFGIKNKLIKFLAGNDITSDKKIILLGLLSSFISVLVINFFGFSVVILNVFLFLIPGIGLVLLNKIKEDDEINPKNINITYLEWSGIFVISVLALGIIIFLFRTWVADTKFALGSNLSRAGEYEAAFPLLLGATEMRNEPLFKDELAANKAILAVGYSQQGTQSATLVQQLVADSLNTSDELTQKYPNNIVYWKTRIRILYILSQVDTRFLPMALDATKKTADIAPTDASVLYNLGVLYGQNSSLQTGEERIKYLNKGIEILKKVVEYKPDYREAYFALGLFYHDLGTTTNGTNVSVIDPTYHQLAIDQMNYILKNLNPNDTQASESLNAWEKER